MIRYIEADDWKSLIDIWADFEGSDYAKYDVPHSLDETEVRKKAAEWALVSPQREHMFFAVCKEDVMIGYTDFHRNSEGYECGYCFHSKYHGKGYARESLQALIKWVSDGNSMRFTAGTAMNNVPSVRLLASLGFEKIGNERVSFYKDESGEDICFDGGVFALDMKY